MHSQGHGCCNGTRLTQEHVHSVTTQSVSYDTGPGNIELLSYIAPSISCHLCMYVCNRCRECCRAAPQPHVFMYQVHHLNCSQLQERTRCDTNTRPIDPLCWGSGEVGWKRYLHDTHRNSAQRSPSPAMEYGAPAQVRAINPSLVNPGNHTCTYTRTCAVER